MLKRYYQLFILIALSLCSHIVTAQECMDFSGNQSAVYVNLSENCEAGDQMNQESDTGNANAKAKTDTNDPISLGDDGFTFNDHNEPYATSFVRRIISADNCASNGIEPSYYLLVAFLSPVLLDIARSDVQLPDPSTHWTSFTLASSRLSGWKETNALYTHQHSRT
ncbi:hypothetical protein [Vibrio genomosp. F10]|nr:hypothetical protein [Vibrio genomosp. F10]